MKKQRYISLIPAVMSGLMVISVCRVSAAMALPLASAAPSFLRVDHNTSAMRSKVLNAKFIELGEKHHPQAVYSSPKFSKPVVTNLESTSSHFPVFIRHNVQTNSADDRQYNAAMASTRSVEGRNDYNLELMNDNNELMVTGHQLDSSGSHDTCHTDGSCCGTGGCSHGVPSGVTGVIPKSQSSFWSWLHTPCPGGCKNGQW